MSEIIENVLTLGGRQPQQVARTTVILVLLVFYGPKFLRKVRREGLFKALFSMVFKAAVSLPGAGRVVSGETDKIIKSMEKDMLKRTSQETRLFKLPANGIPQDELLARLRKWKEEEDKLWKGGKVSGTVYHGDEDFKNFLAQVYGLFALTNPLHPEVFPFVRKMEAEVVRMCVSLFNGGEKQCGVMTSGGTESIIMACKAHREWGKTKGIEYPEIVAPVSAHAAFDKAADYFGMKLVSIDVDPVTYMADLKKMEAAINSNTVLIVGSAPGYPQGVMDDIEGLSKLAVKHKTGMHVDCCLGSLLMPMLGKIGYSLPPFDFRLPGVTSISCDTHKFGFAPKGSSVVMYTSAEMRRHQYFVATEWTGGIYASPSVAGSRVGGIIAATWAAMVSLGEDGYKRIAREIMSAAQEIAEGIRKMNGLELTGTPVASVVAFKSSDPKIDIYKVAGAMSNRGWHLNVLQNPGSIHICCTYMHRKVAKTFLKELQESATEARDHPERFKDGQAAVYGMNEIITERSIIGDVAKGFIDCLYKV